MKLIIALATTSVIVTSAFIQPAAAQRRSTGNTYSVMGSNGTQIYYKFNLFDTDNRGNRVYDTAPDNPLVGIFRGVVRNYVRVPDLSGVGFGVQICDQEGRNNYDSNGYPLLYNVYDDVIGCGEDRPILTDPFRSATTLFDVGDFLADLITLDGKQYVRYSIFDEYGRPRPYSNFILDPENLAPSFSPLSEPIELEKAVNDLAYILSNNLLDYVANYADFRPILGLLAVDTDEEIVNDLEVFSIIKQGFIEPQRVPENNNLISGLFAIIYSAVTLLIKPKVKGNPRNK
ncbi:hypothetical protein [Nostoc sp. UHCC 0870]|uniref:hypothetical protein n=1 Tax=Nostoc sp. UHCC 0870 TaxID=2914041 RepID=UPI001EDD43E2|nr:hypothetical protein [Nostoc sp. UHCC 0870]UKP00493.1 hypothetical protein L6494_12650 [Nostoc sp. UHCC 0870]